MVMGNVSATLNSSTHRFCKFFIIEKLLQLTIRYAECVTLIEVSRLEAALEPSLALGRGAVGERAFVGTSLRLLL